MSELVVVAKTGEFHLHVEVGPDVDEDRKHYQWMRLLDKMTRLLADVSKDGRAYEVRAYLKAWRPAGHGMQERRIDFVLVLLDALQAEVGEYVKRPPMAVPDDQRAVRLGEGCGEASGRVFERGWFGWQRVE